jgi:FtsZ-binding cell division protein ZapB
VAHGAAQTGNEAGAVLSASDRLSREAEQLRARIDGFLERLRAA